MKQHNVALPFKRHEVQKTKCTKLTLPTLLFVGLFVVYSKSPLFISKGKVKENNKKNILAVNSNNKTKEPSVTVQTIKHLPKEWIVFCDFKNGDLNE